MSVFEQKLIDAGLESIRKSQSTKDSIDAWRYCQVALMQFAQARWIDPQNQIALYYEEEILKELGFRPEAAGYFQTALKLKPALITSVQEFGDGSDGPSV